MVKVLLSTLILLISSTLLSQVESISDDTDWSSHQMVLQDAKDAEYVIRIGDIDNFGFGWPQKFDPFCDIMTTSHAYPWDADQKDIRGFDQMLVSSIYKPSSDRIEGSDAYSQSFDPIKSKPSTWTLPTSALKETDIKNAYLQLFVDDFQSLRYASKFEFTIEDKRFIALESVLNSLNQTNQVGKLITLPLTPEFYGMLKTKDSIRILLDEVTGAGDGFAIDFMRLLVNKNNLKICKGNLKGKVLDKKTGMPVAGVNVSSGASKIVKTNSKGEFEIRYIPTGLELIKATFKGYEDGFATTDIRKGVENDELIIYLNEGGAATFENEKLRVGGKVLLHKLVFVGMKAAFKLSVKKEVDKITIFLKENPEAVIELAGYTSAGGDENDNKIFTFHRVNFVKNYILSKGIAPDRIFAIGYGSANAIVPNDTERDRRKNRRVEMRLMRL
jgi:OOP family OmpA-OmpF porin